MPKFAICFETDGPITEYDATEIDFEDGCVVVYNNTTLCGVYPAHSFVFAEFNMELVDDDEEPSAE